MPDPVCQTDAQRPGRNAAGRLRYWFAPLAFAFLQVQAAPVSNPSVEYQVKASLVFNFMHFIEWPPEVFRDGRITGLSKVARLVDGYARRPQVQERLTTQIADDLEQTLQPRGVLVVIEAEHLCMSMRGVRKQGSTTVTSAVRGLFRRTVIVGRTVTLIGWWRTRHVEVRQAEPVVIDDRFELLFVWAPEVVTTGGDVMVLNDHAGFSRSEHRPNRRVARVCTRLTDHTSGGPSPAGRQATMHAAKRAVASRLSDPTRGSAQDAPHCAGIGYNPPSPP